jgi:hypothetical protein
MSIFKIVHERSKTVLNFSPCSTSHHSIFSTSERLTFSSIYFYQKDERALPGDLQSRTYLPLPLPLNIVSLATLPPLSLLSLIPSGSQVLKQYLLSFSFVVAVTAVSKVPGYGGRSFFFVRIGSSI